MFDLIGMEVKDYRAKSKVTVLTRENGWDRQDVIKIVELNAVVHEHPQYPKVLLVRGKWTKLQIKNAVGFSDFERHIVIGLDNPDLPFSVPLA